MGQTTWASDWGASRRSVWGPFAVSLAGTCCLFGPQAAQAQTQPQIQTQPQPINPDYTSTEANGPLATNGIDSRSYDRGRNISVRQRPRPDYEAIGIDLPGFMIYPKVNLAFAYDSNIFALHSHQISDGIFTATPEIDFNSKWSRNGLWGFARVAQDVYFKNHNENATGFDTGLAGKLQFGNSTLKVGGEFGRFIQPRATSNNIGLPLHRIPYYYGDVNGQLTHEFARVRLSARVDYEHFDYKNGHTAAGALVFVQDQNHGNLTVVGKAEVAITPDAAVFVSAQGNDRRYDLNPPLVGFTRNNKGYEVDAGANFDLTHLLRGEFQIGYLDQTFSSHLFAPIRGLGGKAQLEWFPTPLITVTVSGSRTVGDAGVIGSAGYLASGANLQIDYELRRNVILTGTAWVAQDKYNGVDRSDQLGGASASANWLLNRHLGLTFAYTYYDQSSHGSAAGPSFNDHRVSLSAIVQY